MNLLKETIDCLTDNGHSIEDVIWVGSCDGNFAISWDDFTQIADIDYDSSFGHPEIATDLVVVGEGWWLEREEYDGSEWWEFKTHPKQHSSPRSFSRVTNPTGCGWEKLININKG